MRVIFKGRGIFFVGVLFSGGYFGSFWGFFRVVVGRCCVLGFSRYGVVGKSCRVRSFFFL